MIGNIDSQLVVFPGLMNEEINIIELIILFKEKKSEVPLNSLFFYKRLTTNHDIATLILPFPQFRYVLQTGTCEYTQRICKHVTP